MGRIAEVLVALNAALGIATWLSVRRARRARERQGKSALRASDHRLPPATPDKTDET